ncbi:MAG: GEVED domain-containing protein [Flavobacteriales bacterium]
MASLLFLGRVQAQYCTNSASPAFTFCSVAFADIDNSSIDRDNGYVDYTGTVGHVLPGMGYSLTVNTDVGYSMRVVAFFDWDGDGSFETRNNMGDYASSSCSPRSPLGSINVPNTAATGNTRMRVIQSYAGFGDVADACTAPSYGQVLDFTLAVGPAPSCYPPTSLQASNLLAHSASLSWTASQSNPASGYQWEVRASGNPGDPSPAASGNAMGISASTSGLSSNTTYRFYVRSDCGGGDLSAWASSGSFKTDLTCGDAWVSPGGATTMTDVQFTETHTYCPETPGDVVTLDFTSWNGLNWNAPNRSGIFIYDGDNTSAPLVAGPGTAYVEGVYNMPAGGWTSQLGNENKPPTTTSTAASGCLTVQAYSYGSWVSSGGYQNGWSANITCAPAPTCLPPSARTVTGTTAHGASFSWNPGASPNVEYRVVANGGTPASPVLASGTSSTSTASASGLAANTTYTAFFRGLCDGGNDPSVWSIGVNFLTKPGCGGPYDMFYRATGTPTPFDSVMTICPDNAGDVVTYTISQLNLSNVYTYSAFYVYDGPNVSAPMLPSNLLGLSSGSNSIPPGGYYGSTYRTNLPGPFTSTHPSGCLTLRFRAVGVDTYYDKPVKGTVSCAPAPACSTPSGVSTSNISGTQVTLSWANTTQSCIVEYGPVGFTPGTGATAGTNGTVVSGLTPPAILTGLSYNTTYDVYVRQVCSGPSYSANSFKANFSTSMDCSQATVLTCAVGRAEEFTGVNGSASYHSSQFTNATGCFPGYSQGLNGETFLYRITAGTTGDYQLSFQRTAGTGDEFFLTTPVANGCAAAAFTCIGGSYFPREYSYATSQATGAYTVHLDAGDHYILMKGSPTVKTVNLRMLCPGVPECPPAPTYPPNNATVASSASAFNYTWPAAFGATGYDIYFNGTPVATVGTNSVASGSYTTANIAALLGVGTPATWRVEPKNSYGTAQCPNWSFSVGGNGSTNAIPLTEGVARTGNNQTGGYTSLNSDYWGKDMWFKFTASNCADSAHVQFCLPSTASSSYMYLVARRASDNAVVFNKQVYVTSGECMIISEFDYDWYYSHNYEERYIITPASFPVAHGETYYLIADGYDNTNYNFSMGYTEVKDLTDSDGDGTPDCLDACPENPDLTAETVCGCQVATDTDGDGIADCIDLCPSLAGEPGGPCNAGPFYLSGEIDDDCNCIGGTPVPTVDWSLKLKTDHGDETSWEIREVGSNFLVAHGDPVGTHSPTETTTPVTIPDAGHFTLRVLDSGNNGMGADGGYVLYDHNGKRVIDNWGNGGGFTSVSESPEGFTTPVGTDGLTAAQCDNVERLANEMIICNVNPLVSAKWGVGDQTTSGYEFWFFDPNGSYSRHILRPHATSGGYAPADATRAAKLGLASWSVNPLPANTLLNVRVRGRVEGVNLPFGPACRLKVDPVAAECHTTQLENLPGSNLSCGVTGLRTNGSNAIYAKPVRRYIAATNTYVSANRYKFHFENTGEGQHFDIVQSTYPMVIYSNMPFRLGATYDVTVQASMDGGVSYCPVGATCQISFATSNARMEEVAGTSPSDLLLWPNPNRGDELYLSMGQLEGTNGKVTVDVVNMFGERVLGTTVAVNGTSLNTVLSLNKDLASGLYLVNLTAGDRVITKRLVIQH